MSCARVIAVAAFACPALYGSPAFAPRIRRSSRPRRRRAAAAAKSPERALLDQYCVTCHNQRAKTADIAFDTAGPRAAVRPRGRVGKGGAEAARRHDAAAGRAPAGSGGRRRPGVVAGALARPGRRGATRIRDAWRCTGSTAPSTPMRSRNCSALRIDASAFLPKDDEADGFDNVASVLKVSPSFLDQYISAARVVSTRALGNPSPRPASATYRPARGTDQSAHVDGLPLGTRGGLLAEHLFPADGDYKLNIGGLASRRLRARDGVSPHARRHASTAPRSSRGRSAARKT